MKDSNFKKLDSLVDEVKKEKINHVGTATMVAAMSRMYKPINTAYEDECIRVDNILDDVIKYCYAKGIKLFILEDVIKEMLEKNLLKDDLKEELNQDIVVDVLQRKNVKFSYVEEELAINISNKNYLSAIIISVIFAGIFDSAIIRYSPIMDLYIADAIRKTLVYIFLIVASIYMVKLMYVIKEKRFIRKKLEQLERELEDNLKGGIKSGNDKF